MVPVAISRDASHVLLFPGVAGAPAPLKRAAPPPTAHSEHVSRSGWQEGTVPGRPSAGGLKDTSRIPSAGQDLVERLALATLNGVAGCRPLTLSINP